MVENAVKLKLNEIEKFCKIRDVPFAEFILTRYIAEVKKKRKNFVE